jgi:hypothetical protein
MLINEPRIDDFKTDRKDIAPPLPTILRLVPLLFYCSIGLTIALSLVFFSQLRAASAKRDSSTAQEASLKVQTQETINQRTALEAQIKKANAVESWITSARPLQPLVVDIARSMGPKSSILDLRLDRIPELPSQLRLSLKLATDTTKQLDTTMEAIAKHKYRSFSPVQSLGRGELDYRATLVRQELVKNGEEAR